MSLALPQCLRALCPLTAAAVLATLALPASSAARPTTRPLTSSNNTPFPTSGLITRAQWTSNRYGPPANQFGDILSTSSTDSRSLFILMDDGGTDTSAGELWRNSFARVTGTPGHLRFSHVGSLPAPATWSQITANPKLWTGALGSYYSMGFAAVGGVFYATQASDWDWSSNAPFTGLAGIAYSTDVGGHWTFPGTAFPAPLGNLNFVQFSSAGAGSGGYVYALATEREFNAGTLFLGRALADVADITDPAKWQWASGPAADGTGETWTNSLAQALPVLSWSNHITYPRMSYDAPLHRYLLTFTFSYAATPPGLWTRGSELVILESPQPWGPFSFVARQSYFGPSNGYDPALPENWISSDGKHLWLIWAANFAGCNKNLDCSGAYGFNYRRLQLTLASPGASATGPRHLPRKRHRLPHVYVAPPTSRRPQVHEEPEPWPTS